MGQIINKFQKRRVQSLIASAIALLFTSITFFRCDKEDEKKFEDFILELPMSVSPSSSIFSIGDTLWLEANIPDSITEFNSQKKYRLIDFNFNAKLGLFELAIPEEDLGDQPGATAFFQIYPQTGSVPALGETFSSIKYLYEDNLYKCRIGIIPKKTGIYSLSLLSPMELDLRKAIILEPTDDGRQRVPVYEDLFFILNNGETNFDLFQQHCKAQSIEHPFIRNIYAEQKGTYTFEVIE